MANITIANLGNQQASVEGLNDYSYTIQNAGTKNINVHVTDASGDVSGITVLIKVGSSTKVTATGAAGANGISAGLQWNFSANDVLHVVISSSTAGDAAPNQVFATIFMSSLTGGEG